jgi:crossover junction endodeoxyribonuclease RuvC
MGRQRIYIGVDPGKSGAVSILYEDGKWSAIKTSSAPEDIISFMVHGLPNWKTESEKLDVTICFEAVHAGAWHVNKDGSRRVQGVTSAFTFGRSTGILEGLLSSLGLPIQFVSPRKWQAEMNCLTRGDKRITLARAKELHPITDAKIYHWNADALLLAHYAKKLRESKSPDGKEASTARAVVKKKTRKQES